MSDDTENLYTDFDPYDMLQELARQNKELFKQLNLVITNQHALAAAFNDQQTHIERQGKLIRQLQNRVFNLYFISNQDDQEETNSRPTRQP